MTIATQHSTAPRASNRTQDLARRLAEAEATIDALRAGRADAIIDEDRMRCALQNAKVGIWDMDYTTGVLRWSETVEVQYGLLPKTFGGTYDAYMERVHPDDRKALVATLNTAMKSGDDFGTLHRSLWPDGTVRWLSGAGRIRLGDQGEPVRGVGISLDVTENHRLQAQGQQAQKMEAVGRLAGGVAHDFNNLLTVILGNCELLLFDEGTRESRKHDVAEIQKAGASAVGLTRQLLAFSRKEVVEPTLLDLNVVAANMRAMLERLIREDVKVVLDLSASPKPITADRAQLEQIVLNLALNARDAMPAGGTLTVATGEITLTERDASGPRPLEPGAYVVLTVSDTGVGMTPEVQAHLFEPFFTTKGAGLGTGIGLATVDGIVTQAGGSISVRSDLGKGTSFTVNFPMGDRAAFAVATPLPPSRRRSATETVLLVEDAEGLRELATRLLRHQGYTVLVAENAAEALRVFEASGTIDVLLTDVVMPGASGPELSKQLVERHPSLKVIYMSGYAESESSIVQHGVLKPGIAFLRKPFTSETLGRKVREVLDS